MNYVSYDGGCRRLLINGRKVPKLVVEDDHAKILFGGVHREQRPSAEIGASHESGGGTELSIAVHFAQRPGRMAGLQRHLGSHDGGGCLRSIRR